MQKSKRSGKKEKKGIGEKVRERDITEREITC